MQIPEGRRSQPREVAVDPERITKRKVTSRPSAALAVLGLLGVGFLAVSAAADTNMTTGLTNTTVATTPTTTALATFRSPIRTANEVRVAAKLALGASSIRPTQ